MLTLDALVLATCQANNSGLSRRTLQHKNPTAVSAVPMDLDSFLVNVLAMFSP